MWDRVAPPPTARRTETSNGPIALIMKDTEAKMAAPGCGAADSATGDSDGAEGGRHRGNPLCTLTYLETLPRQEMIPPLMFRTFV